MKLVKKLIKKIIYVFITINKDIKQRYETEMDVENTVLLQHQIIYDDIEKPNMNVWMKKGKEDDEQR